jgi:hypothetical protein
MKYNNKFLHLYINFELLSRINIISREFLHLSFIYNFFRTQQENNEKQSELTKSIKRIENIMKYIYKEIDSIYENYNNLKKYFQQIDDDDSDDKVYKQNKSIFEIILETNIALSKILENLSFVQRKIRYTLEAFPPYYPNPNLFRARQELKAYEILQELSDEFLKFNTQLCNNLFNLKDNDRLDNDSIQSIVYWTTDAENNFQEQTHQKCFLFNGSFFTVNQSSLWIILAHETLHYLLNLISNKQNNFFSLKMKVAEIFIEAKFFDNISWDTTYYTNLFPDIFCDSILTYLFGLPYYIAISRLLFLKETDIKNLYNPSYRMWWIRMHVISRIFKKFNENKIINDILEILENNHNLIKTIAPYKNMAATFCYYETVVSDIFFEIMKNFIKNRNDKLEEIKQNINKMELIALYKYMIRFIIDNMLNPDFSLSKLNEGRINVLLNKDKKIFSFDKFSDKEYDKLQNFLKNCQKNTVLLLSFLKIRYDGYAETEKILKWIDIEEKIQNFKTINNDKAYYFYHLGQYNLVAINPKFSEKPVNNNDSNFKEYKYIFQKIYDYSSKGIDNLDTNNITMLWTPLIKNNILFYKEDIATSALYLSKQYTNKSFVEVNDDNLKTFLSKAEKNLLILLQLKFNDDNDSTDEQSQNFSPPDIPLNDSITDIVNKIKTNLELCIDDILITYHFGWCDWILLINVSSNYYNAISKLKELVLKEDSKIKKSKTDILIGSFINIDSNEEKIPAPNFLLRLATSKPKKIEKFEQTIKNIERELKQSKKWKLFLKPGIYDLLLAPDPDTKNGYTISINDYFKALKQILNDDHTVSDIQTIINLPYQKNNKQ